MADRIDLEAEGLLDGVEADSREARSSLLEQLLAAGAEPEELRQAIREGRLTLLPVERTLAGEERFTPRQVAASAGVPLSTLEHQWAALGMVVGDPDEPTQTGDDLAAARRIRAYLDAGLDPETMAETGRVMAMALSQVAAANRQTVNRLLGPAEDSGGEDEALDELELARRLEALAASLMPLVGPSLEHVYKLQLREQLRHAAVDLGSTGSGGTGAGTEVAAVAFADLVGFTRLGEQLPAEEFGGITGRFAELAAGVATGPVRLVKLIGDAAMLSAPGSSELVAAVLQLIDLVGEEGEGFPDVRAGLSVGAVVQRGGDLYGSTVNRASRISGVARPASLLVGEEVASELEGSFRFSDAGRKRLKGIDVPVRIFRCRNLEPDEGDESG